MSAPVIHLRDPHEAHRVIRGASGSYSLTECRRVIPTRETTENLLGSRVTCPDCRAFLRSIEREVDLARGK